MRGFTLLELLVVIVIAGIMAAVVAPRFSEPSAYEARAQAEVLLMTLRSVQSLAVARRATVYVQASASTGAVQVCADSACTQIIPTPEGDALWLQLSGDLRLQASSNWSYDSMGRPSAAPLLTLVTASGAFSGYAVQVEAESGYAHLQ